MMDKKAYIEPEMVLIQFDFNDSITTSSGGTEGDMGGGIVLPDDEW